MTGPPEEDLHPMNAARKQLGIATVIVIVAGAIASAANG